MTLLIISCDNHKDVVEQYMHYLRINWPDCAFSVVVATEDCDISDSDSTIIKCGKGVLWTKEVLIALNHIDTKYVLMTVDDFYISRKINSEIIFDALSFMENNKIKYYRIPRADRSIKKKDLYPGQTYVSKVRKNVPYSVSIGSAIWEKEELISILGDGTQSAWQIEDHFTKIAIDSGPGYYDGYASDARSFMQCAHMVTNGKWIPSGLRLMKKRGYIVDLGKRPILSKREVFSMNIRIFATKITPKRLRVCIKKFFKGFGVKFASNH